MVHNLTPIEEKLLAIITEHINKNGVSDDGKIDLPIKELKENLGLSEIELQEKLQDMIDIITDSIVQRITNQKEFGIV